tara:strand:- start:389 stop:634 length:246 start_codon:yes stop_codon:yes gene_type:complete
VDISYFFLIIQINNIEIKIFRMTDFFEIDEKNKTIKSLNLDDLSIEDLKKYTDELLDEIERVKLEISKKQNSKESAESFFK